MNNTVTAVVPSMAEKTLPESLACLERQSVKLADVIVIRNVSPFPAAMNRGVAQVKTPFLLQCDADMILHPDCVETLLSGMDENTGVSIGYLLDDLLGDIQAVKLYRTKCLRIAPFEDNIASDTTGITKIIEHGFRITFASRTRPYGNFADDVLGLHKPNYDDPLYVYGKFSVMGSVVRSRGSYPEYLGVLSALRRSPHTMSDLALTAFCHGVFKNQTSSGHKPFEESEDYQFIANFRSRPNGSHRLFAVTRVQDYDRAEELEALHLDPVSS
jgi:glycosyltransferase involved in cell wall biosynthesis